MKLTHDAATALREAGFSRRRFLQGSGALIVGFSVFELAGTFGIVPEAEAAQGPAGPQPRAQQLDSWIVIAADGSVIAYTGKCELGQGLFTAQTQLVAEELRVPIERVKLIQCDTSITPDQGTTSGAQSHPANFNDANLALAAATARHALVRLGSERLGVPVGQLEAVNGRVAIKGDPSRSVGYGELIGGRTFQIPLDARATRRAHGDWTVLGKSVPRVDIPDLVTGRAEFVHNVRVPGMLHGRPVRPPSPGATLVSVDESSVSGMPGFVKVVVKNNFVGVVAEKPWQAVQAAGRLKIVWKPGSALPSQSTYYDHLRTQQPRRDEIVVDSGDVDATLASAARVVRATYLHPYQMHASIGSSCAVADVQGGRATIWAASQNVWALRSSSAIVLGLTPDDVRVVFVRGSGCYGINGADTIAYDAALMSQAAGRPVRVQLTRKDEMAWENYGLPFVTDLRAGLDAKGNIVAWDYESWSAARGGRPGAANPGNVATGFHAGLRQAAFQPRTPAPAPTGELFVNDNTASQYVRGSVEGKAQGTGTVASERVIFHRVESPFFTGPLRAPARLQNTYANESFVDELAAIANADPVAYRLRHIHDSRLADVITTTAKAAAWDARPSPKPGTPRTGIAAGRGFASVVCEGNNGWVAAVAEVRVDQGSGRVSVTRLVVGSDSGPISNPDGTRNQIEGGALHGLSRAMAEEVTWDDQQITSVDWPTYGGLSFGELPQVEVVLIDRPDRPAAGAGESSITVVAAAVANAIFDATGARVRQVPFTAQRVKAALSARPVGGTR